MVNAEALIIELPQMSIASYVRLAVSLAVVLTGGDPASGSLDTVTWQPEQERSPPALKSLSLPGTEQPCESNSPESESSGRRELRTVLHQ